MSVHQRVDHLVSLWKLDREHRVRSRSTVLDALARLGRSNAFDRDQRVSPEELRNALAQMWTLERAHAETLPGALPVWLELAFVNPGFDLEPDPRQVVLDELSRASVHAVGRTTSALLTAVIRYVAASSGPLGQRARFVVEGHLLASNNRDEEWATAVRDLGRHHLTRELAEAGLDWAMEQAASAVLPDVLVLAARVQELRSRSLKLYLERGERNRAWARLAAQLARAPDTRDSITEHLRTALVDWQSGHLLAALLDARQLRNIDSLRGWLRMHESSPLIDVVLQAAVRAGFGGEPIVAATALRSVRAGSSRSGQLLASTLDNAGEAEIDEVLSHALGRLPRVDTRDWAAIWEAAWKRAISGERAELLELLSHRLNQRGPAEQRARWWCLAIDYTGHSEELHLSGEALMRELIGKPGFSFVFQRLWGDGVVSRQNLVVLGRRHLHAGDSPTAGPGSPSGNRSSTTRGSVTTTSC